MEIISKRALNHEDTELRLGLPGTDNGSEKSSSRTNKRAFTEMSEESTSGVRECDRHVNPPAKVQAIGWPPIRSYRRNSLQTMKEKVENSGMYVKVSMDGAAYLRKIDLNLYEGYSELLKALEDMFNFKLGEYFKREGYNGSEYEPTYEDKDGDWMLVGDVPWEMFVTSCKRLRIVRAS